MGRRRTFVRCSSSFARRLYEIKPRLNAAAKVTIAKVISPSVAQITGVSATKIVRGIRAASTRGTPCGPDYGGDQALRRSRRKAQSRRRIAGLMFASQTNRGHRCNQVVATRGPALPRKIHPRAGFAKEDSEEVVPSGNGASRPIFRTVQERQSLLLADIT
jgi:hypothetical protein